MKDKDYDCSQIDDNLNGDSACHLMNSDEISKCFKNREETQANDNDRGSQNLIQSFLLQSKEENLEVFTDIFKKLGLGYRKKYQISENKELKTALEKCLFQKEYSSFQQIYDANCKDGDIMLLYRVIMRNLQLILATPQLELQMRNFFNEDKDNLCQVRFAMVIELEDLPVYQNCSTIAGADYDIGSIKPDSQEMIEALGKYGGISESNVKTRYFDRELVDKSKTKSVLINYNIDVFDLKCTNFE